MMKLIILLCGICFLLTAGYAFPGIKNKTISRIACWTLLAFTTLAAILFTVGQIPPVRMIVIVSLLLLSVKVVVLNETYTGSPRLNFIQWIAFAIGWFGMRPMLFESLPSAPIASRKIFVKAIFAITLGIVILHLSVAVEFTILHSFTALLTLIGLSLVLHFGILNLSTAGWRSLGVNVKELFRSPYRSTSLKEFWGKRWNIAFSEMTALIVFKQLKDRYSSEVAVFVAFLFSGLLHEIAISFPVNSGYGFPFLYFVIHAIAMVIEDKSSLIKKLLRHDFAARTWVFCWIIFPLPLLFHTAFVEQVLKPIRNVIVFW